MLKTLLVFACFASFPLTAFCHPSESRALGDSKSGESESGDSGNRNSDKARPNILFIAVDDLRPELGCYGAKHIKSPNIDKFAASGRLFRKAYCQQAVCNPSRTSLMTGLRPDTIGVTTNHAHFRTKHPDVVTLPQHFKNHGYHAAAIGKIYHGVFPEGASATKWDTMGDPVSWSVPAVRFGPRYYYTEDGINAAKEVYERIYRPKDPAPDDWTKKLVFGPATESPDVADNVLYDGKVADAAVKRLKALKESEEPFFLAVGFIKPHSPYIAPKKYFDLYDKVELPKETSLPDGASSFAGHGSGELRRYTDQPKRGEISAPNQLRVRRAYYACTSFIDAQIGRVLSELERLHLDKNTIVVLFGDHGYHLGEQGLWGKTTNFELDTRVPLIIRAPGMKFPGMTTDSLVELVDIYPTLAELAGLPISKRLEGKSLVSTINGEPDSLIKTEAISQYPRGNGIMGYSMRTSRLRLTQWVHLASGEVRETELYDYFSDRGGLIEKQNVAAKVPGLVQSLTKRLSKKTGVNFKSKKENRRGLNESTSFEKAKPGQFKKLVTPIGEWKVESGEAIVDDKHAKTGKHCLQLKGGDKTVVTLSLANGVDTRGELRFWAERWTRRGPFTFRIEKSSGEGWKEVFNGDKVVRVGRAFLSDIRVPLGDESIRKLRFTVTSPPETGILIDDILFAEAKPQRITNVESIPLTLPALVGAKSSPILKIKVTTEGNLNPVSLKELTSSLKFDAGAIESAQVYFGGSDSRFAAGSPFGQLVQGKALKPLAVMVHKGDQKLSDGDNYFWITARISKEANIERKVGATCSRAVFSNGKEFELNAQSTQRLGVAVRQGGDDGVHTFRIPGLATTNRGTLIGVYDVRRRGGRDLPGDIDVGMSRSTDGGQTWEPMKVIMDMGNDPKWNYDGIGDPAVLVDRTTGTIWVAATWSHGNRSWVGSGPGLKPEETGQFMLVRSDDDGVTWSKPINTTEQIKKPEWCFILQGPGKGITMRDGTIVFPAQYQDPPNTTNKTAHRLPHSTIIYSKDHGKTWNVGTGAFDDTTEAQVVEVEPGVLMLNCRYNRKSVRVVMTTRDMGKTWQKHSTSELSLIEPRACMASLIDAVSHLSWQKNIKEKTTDNWLLFSNPNSLSGRNHITIKASPDRGLSWPKANRLLIDEERSAGYSCMTMIDDDHVGILYEGSQAHMTFQRIPLKDLIEDPPAKSNAAKEEDKVSLTMPQVFSDHMVLQQGKDIPVWGRAPPNAAVSVTLGTEKKNSKADNAGNWQVELKARAANSNPQKLIIQSGKETIQLSDVLIGEVWVCAGQSNMEWPLKQSTQGSSSLKLAGIPTLRLLHLSGGARGSSGSYSSEHLLRLTPSTYCKGTWQTASANSAANFSAVAWHFGRKLQRELQVPVGLICPAVGGTPTEAWISGRALKSNPQFHEMVVGNWMDNPRLGDFCKTRGKQNLLEAIQSGETVPQDELGPNHSFKPGFMWDAGIKPLIPFSIRGVVWYQGESNAESSDRTREHSQLFRLLINDWRKKWRQGDFPFLYVQLPAINRAEWPWFRDGQRRVLDDLKNVGMAVTIDTGHPTNVHPSLKKPVGERLAAWALGTTYQKSRFKIYSGPLFDSFKRQNGSISIMFKHAGRGLQTSEGRTLRHFEVCGADGIYHPAEAKIIDSNTISVASPSVLKPRHVRYAWVPYPKPKVNLVNSSLMPASPFSTESEEATYKRNQVKKAKDVSTDRRPNILLIVGEDHGCELSCYGDEVISTPNIDQLAKTGVVFESGYVTQSVCSPSRSTIFTGLYPHQNGQLGLATHNYRWFKKWPTTYSLLKEAGYRTGLIGKTHILPADAVESYVDFRFQSGSNFSKKKVAEYAVKAGEFFGASKKPFFLTVNYPDAHWPLQNQVDGLPSSLIDPNKIQVMPYVGDSTPRLREVVGRYYNCMLRLDECVGQLLLQLEKSGKAENTLVVFVGDHGAQMARGKVTVYEGGMRVPFIVRWPEVAKAGLRSRALVSTIDLLPTFMDVAGVSAPKGLPGKSLRAAVTGSPKSTFRKYLVCERNCDSAHLTFPQRTIRDQRYKLIHSPVRDREDPAARYYRIHGASHWAGSLTDEELAGASQKTKNGYERWLHPPEYQLYDLAEDPHEWNDLSENPKLDDVRQRLMSALGKWQKETDDPIANPKKLQMLLAENDSVAKTNRRSPKTGWQYLKYLSSDN